MERFLINPPVRRPIANHPKSPALPVKRKLGNTEYDASERIRTFQAKLPWGILLISLDQGQSVELCTAPVLRSGRFMLTNTKAFTHSLIISNH